LRSEAKNQFAYSAYFTAYSLPIAAYSGYFEKEPKSTAYSLPIAAYSGYFE